MYMRIAWGRVESGKWPEYLAAYKEGAAAAGAAPGLTARTLSRDIDLPDTGYSITSWESAAAMENYEQAAAKEILPRIAQYFPTAFVINRVEIVHEQQYK